MFGSPKPKLSLLLYYYIRPYNLVNTAYNFPIQLSLYLPRQYGGWWNGPHQLMTWFLCWHSYCTMAIFYVLSMQGLDQYQLYQDRLFVPLGWHPLLAASWNYKTMGKMNIRIGNSQTSFSLQNPCTEIGPSEVRATSGAKGIVVGFRNFAMAPKSQK